MIELILKKRHGIEHSREELEQIISGSVSGDIPDYQLSAWLMATCFQGMSPQETADLTNAMAQSGDMLDLSALNNTVDKHSTGGVGDKTSLVLAPLLAACGATVAKMSGRGLGHTGGTVDKLESIPNFKSELSDDAFIRQAQSVGVVITGQSKDLAPADGKLYGLRDVTGTVESMPLIASSIMSKKLASGAKSMVLDVKVGTGAFMKNLDDARELAKAMVDTGKRNGRNMRAIISDMNQPLGFAIGNASEVNEAIACLKGENIPDLRELSIVLAYEVLDAVGIGKSKEEIATLLDNGTAFEKFIAWVEAQGSSGSSLENGLELAGQTHVIKAASSGTLQSIDTLAVGNAVKLLGGGRQQKTDVLELGVGIHLHAKVGDEVSKGDVLMEVFHNSKGLEVALNSLESACVIGDASFAELPLVYERLS